MGFLLCYEITPTYTLMLEFEGKKLTAGNVRKTYTLSKSISFSGNRVALIV